MIQFTHPIYLALLPPLIYFTWKISKISLADLPRGRKQFSLGLRIAILCLIVTAIAGIQTVKSSKHLAVIFALDVSDSVPPAKRQLALDYINDAIKTKRSGDYVGVVVFGADASVETAPSQLAKVDRIFSVPSSSYTDISQGIGLAIASFPADASKRIVLISDGNENIGKVIDQAAMAQTEGIFIDVLPVDNDIQKETLLDKMIVPSEAKIGEPFDLKIVAAAKSDTQARIRLLRNGMQVDTRTVSLTRGKNVLTFPQTIEKEGAYSYEALLDGADDTITDNNRAIGTTLVHGKPKILYVEGEPGQPANLSKALSASDINVDVKNPAAIPTSLDELRNYDSIIFSDVPAMSLTPDQMKIIEAGVRDLGVGFGMVGGDNSFGAGGYFNTPIERALPVDMSIRKQKVVPSLTVVIVIDKSGSMGMEEDGRTKISLANEAAINVVNLLQPIDKVSVIFCHDYPVTIIPLCSPIDKNAIAAKISTVNAEGGGITCFPSLTAANKTISSCGTRQRHVMMLCDGDDCDDPEGCVQLAHEMQKKSITVSSIAFGDGKDVPFLKAMAAAGGGNFYMARRARELPYIFTKDVMIISKTLLVEEPFYPKVDTSAPVLSGIDWKSVPPLLGYVATSPKPMAEVPIVSHKDDPIYAQWQYGLGRSIAFTSDAKPKWAVRWLGWDGFPKFWAQAVRWSMKKSGKTDYQTTVDVDNAVGHVVVDAVDPNGHFINFLKLEGRVIPPSMKSVPVTLEQTAPGRYEAEFPAREVGTYTVNVVQKQGKEISSQACTLTIPYPPEYKDIQTNRRLLERLASMTGGKFGPKPADVFKPDAKRARIPSDIWWTLVLIAILLFPLDVAVRRLAMDTSEVRDLAVKYLQTVQAATRREKMAKRPEERTETVGQLLGSKKSRQQTEGRPDWARPQVSAQQPKQVETSESDVAKPETPAGKPVDDGNTTSRLLEAKRRSKGKH